MERAFRLSRVSKFIDRNWDTMKIFKKVIGFVMAFMLIAGAAGHFFAPEAYVGFIPDFIPEKLANWSSGIVELGLGIAILVPKYRKKALLGTSVLMVLFLPFHVVDAFRENPVIGTKAVALLRVFIQFLLIYLPWFSSKD
ncbi:MAG: putative membrane protein [Gammaproteobacteria bacterium]|jgi:uncharacterized membrane protein